MLNGQAQMLLTAQANLGIANNLYKASVQKLNDVVSALGEETVTLDPVSLQASLTTITAQLVQEQPIQDQPVQEVPAGL